VAVTAALVWLQRRLAQLALVLVLALSMRLVRWAPKWHTL